MGYIKESFNIMKLIGNLCLRCTVLVLAISGVVLGAVYFASDDPNTAGTYVQTSIDRAIKAKNDLVKDVQESDIQAEFDAGSLLDND
ncbi:MAG: hypothetical protein CMQ41_07830 [Gammaproteobacteria bacterium]|nr:hypothetical protein [Gammaproteobacteria bacterium]